MFVLLGAAAKALDSKVVELYRAGRYKEAISYAKALEIYDKVLGGEQPDTATSLNNLAELYRSTGAHSSLRGEVINGQIDWPTDNVIN